jgi:hypothetical protein
VFVVRNEVIRGRIRNRRVRMNGIGGIGGMKMKVEIEVEMRKRRIGRE